MEIEIDILKRGLLKVLILVDTNNNSFQSQSKSQENSAGIFARKRENQPS